MKYLLILALIITAVMAFYIVVGRPRLKAWFPSLFNWLEPIEITIWGKSETILKARLMMFWGAFLTFLNAIGTIDLSPIMPFIPEQHQWLARAVLGAIPMILSLVGWVDERLRDGTTKPIELVALPDDKSTLPPAVEAAVAQADVAKVQAVAVVEAAKV